MPDYSLDINSDLKGRRVALTMTGGIGDALMAVGGTACALEGSGAVVTGLVMPHQQKLLRACVGVHTVLGVRALNDPVVRNGFDVVIDFACTFNRSRELRRGDYYGHVSARAGFAVGPGRFTFGRNPEHQVVAIHPASSNPNRAWKESGWREIALRFAAMGWRVLWLGTSDEFGFSTDNIIKLSDMDGDLLWQAKAVSRCSLFVGSDSGFAHIAGILGVPGVVVFTATEPEDVLGQYPSLKAAEVFGRLGEIPSRSLRPDDPVAARCSEALSVEDVWAVLDFPIPDVDLGAEVREPNRRRLCIAGPDASLVVSWVSGIYDLVDYPRDSEAVLNCPSSGVVVCIIGGRHINLRGDSKPELLRGLREIFSDSER